MRAYHARRDGKLREATAPLEAWVAKKPDDFPVQAVLAEAYAQGGQRRKAAKSTNSSPITRPRMPWC